MTADRQRQLRVAQRRMLRKIIQTPRTTQEDWITYLKRATTIADNLAAESGVERWVAAQRRRKWRWGGHVLRMQDRRETTI